MYLLSVFLVSIGWDTPPNPPPPPPSKEFSENINSVSSTIVIFAHLRSFPVVAVIFILILLDPCRAATASESLTYKLVFVFPEFPKKWKNEILYRKNLKFFYKKNKEMGAGTIVRNIRIWCSLISRKRACKFSSQPFWFRWELAAIPQTHPHTQEKHLRWFNCNRFCDFERRVSIVVQIWWRY